MKRLGLMVLCFLALAYLFEGDRQAHSALVKLPPQEEAGIKSTRTFYEMLVGGWTGPYSLWTRPGTPVQKSEITAQFQTLAKDNYFLMTYVWEQGGKTQEGVFLFGGHANEATATWGDSFHMVPVPMQCKGELMEDGKKLVFKAKYSVGQGPAWGWRTEFTLRGPDALLMEAYNITPEGLEGLAVKAELKRAAKKDK